MFYKFKGFLERTIQLCSIKVRFESLLTAATADPTCRICMKSAAAALPTGLYVFAEAVLERSGSSRGQISDI